MSKNISFYKNKVLNLIFIQVLQSIATNCKIYYIYSAFEVKLQCNAICKLSKQTSYVSKLTVSK